jgi:hypothetical protein
MAMLRIYEIGLRGKKEKENGIRKEVLENKQ